MIQQSSSVMSPCCACKRASYRYRCHIPTWQFDTNVGSALWMCVHLWRTMYLTIISHVHVYTADPCHLNSSSIGVHEVFRIHYEHSPSTSYFGNSFYSQIKKKQIREFRHFEFQHTISTNFEYLNFTKKITHVVETHEQHEVSPRAACANFQHLRGAKTATAHAHTLLLLLQCSASSK